MIQNLPQPVKDLNKLRKFLRKDYRDGYMQTQVRSGIAYQMQAIRRKLGITQTQMSEKVGKPQSVISRLEDVEYGGVSVQSLLDIASGLDIALLVQFVSYPDFLSRTKDMSDKALQPETIAESLADHDQAHEQSNKMKEGPVGNVLIFLPVLSRGASNWSGQYRDVFTTETSANARLDAVRISFSTSAPSEINLSGVA